MRHALQGWKQTVKKIGKGTGRNAPALKAKARELMSQCQAAVATTLVDRGYHLVQQWKVGAYCLDIHFFMGQGLQPCGVHTADLYFSLHDVPPTVGNFIISTRRSNIHRWWLWIIHKNYVCFLPEKGERLL